MENVKAYVCRESDGTYSVYADEAAPINYGLVGEGSTVEEAVAEWNAMYEAMKESYARDGMDFKEAKFSFVYDVPSFLAYYGRIITFRGLSGVTGISASQLSQYATGYRTPSPRTVSRIMSGLKAFAADLNQISLV